MIQLSFGFGAVEGELWRLLFTMTRIGAALLAAPLFGAASVPMQLRVIITGAIAVMVCGWLPVVTPPALFSLSGLLATLGEVLIGLSIGFVLQLSFAAPTIAATRNALRPRVLQIDVVITVVSSRLRRMKWLISGFYSQLLINYEVTSLY